MVLKLTGIAKTPKSEFENDVKTYGTETNQATTYILTEVWEWCKNVWYWNLLKCVYMVQPFENDVKTYGTETQMRSG